MPASSSLAAFRILYIYALTVSRIQERRKRKVINHLLFTGSQLRHSPSSLLQLFDILLFHHPRVRRRVARSASRPRIVVWIDCTHCLGHFQYSPSLDFELRSSTTPVTDSLADLVLLHQSQHHFGHFIGGHPCVGGVNHLQFLRVVGPQRRLDYTRCHSCDADTKEFVEFGHGAHKTADAVFRG